ncbi:hypothetical protein [Moorena producens]|uniref:hypothetical protein n=1 Tax=Moorena producens TaxID=1155739 RepID=UPI003C725982
MTARLLVVRYGQQPKPGVEAENQGKPAPNAPYWTVPDCLLPLASCLLPTPYSLLPTP